MNQGGLIVVNDYFYHIAEIASEKSGLNVKFIYAQMAHESNNFTSELCVNYHNLSGLTQVEDNGLPQPDGQYFYMSFDTYEDYGNYFGSYLKYYYEDGIAEATTIQEYAEALKRGCYYGDTVENYVNGMTYYYNDAFGNEE